MLDPVHHDGSALYVADESPALGSLVALRLRVPRDLRVDAVRLRTVEDAEPRLYDASEVLDDGTDRWFEAQLPVRNPAARYRWLVQGEALGWGWLTAAGWFTHDVPDAFDFVLVAAPPVPAWVDDAVVYQVFPDRFAPSNHDKAVPDWVVPRPWSDRPEGRGPSTGREWFGGDLWGVIERLDHLELLGVNVLYFTPVFPARSTHRYDASTFEHVDPLLGGDDALCALTAAAHARGIRVIGDFTLNHSGRQHEWFQQALAGDEVTRGFYLFDDALPHGYECWWGSPSLPKFDHRNAELRRRLISDRDSALRRWLRAPFHLDGWRIDVANMTGRHADVDVNHDVAKAVRHAVAAEGADRLLIAEHCHDAGADLDGQGWHGTMNYAAFRNPVVAWLADPEQHAVSIDRVDGADMVRGMRWLSARMPWRALSASWTLLGSHDTARARTVLGDAARQRAAAALLMTLPGTPMVFAGDEFGLHGAWGEDARVTMPWDDPTLQDRATFAEYRSLIALRRAHPALRSGGLRWLHADADTVAFVREAADEVLLVAVARTTAALELHLRPLGTTVATHLHGQSGAVVDGRLQCTFDGAGVGIWSLR